MLVKAKCSKTKEWGFVEKYESYRYNNKGYVKALTSINVKGELSPSYVYRGNEFIPISEIDSEVGIDRYLKAKKPFYAKIKEGFLVVLKASVDFEKKVYIPEESTFEVYTLNGTPTNIDSGLPFKKVLDVPKEFIDIVNEPLRILGESFGDRGEFLRRRVDG